MGLARPSPSGPTPLKPAQLGEGLGRDAFGVAMGGGCTATLAIILAGEPFGPVQPGPPLITLLSYVTPGELRSPKGPVPSTFDSEVNFRAAPTRTPALNGPRRTAE